MSTVIDTLITDRTQADIDALIASLKSGNNPADHKGSYNASDLNRVEQAVLYLVDRLGLIGITHSASMKTDWTNTDILSGVSGILAKIREYRADTHLPESIRKLDYTGANQIEDLLKETELAVTRILLSYRGYSGRQISGVNCLP